MNAYDSGRIADLLARSHGYETVPDPLDADLIVFNTCHVREKAEEKLFSELGRLHKRLGHRPVTFAVGGCVAQAEGEVVLRRAPYVDLVFGPQNYHRLPLLLDRLARGERRLRDTGPPPESKFDDLPEPRASGRAAAVTIQEGCNRFCTYCVVPATRGPEWSRGVEEILAEVAQLTVQGVIEILLLGQNVNAYHGRDRQGVVHDLALLLRRVALVPGVERLRFVTSHPADMNRDLVEVFGDLPQLCPYLHLPVQSGSDAILQRMGRGHRVADYEAWIDQARRVRPDLAVATDFIVGFPGESEADFQATLDLVERVGFDHAYSFKFSARPGTAAVALPDPVPEEVGARRLARLQELLNRQQLARNQARVGTVVPVLVEGPSGHRPGEWAGRAPDMRRVHFPGPANLAGVLVTVRITAGLPNSLRGEPA